MILVTGGTGLLGSHLLFELCKQGFRVRALYRNESKIKTVLPLFKHYSPEQAEQLFQQIEWVKGDIDDIFSLEDALEGIDKVYHCAALVSFDAADRAELIRINEKGTANVVNACLDANISKLCHVSSTAAIGRSKDDSLIHEKTQWKNAPENTWYAISKYNAEREVWRGIEEGLPAVIVNPSVILGPGDWNSSSTSMFRNGSKGMMFYTDGGNAFVDARDVADIMVKLMESPITEERFLCVAENRSFRSLFDEIAQAWGKRKSRYRAGKFLSGIAWRMDKFISFFLRRKALLTKETARAARRTYRYDNSKIKQALNFEFRSIKDTIENAHSYFSKQKN